MDVRFLPAGDTALVVEFGDRVDRELSDAVLRLSARVRAAAVPGVVETVPTYRSLLVHYDPSLTGAARLQTAIEKMLAERAAEGARARLWRIPACYAPMHAPDLAEVAERTGLTVEDIVRIHTGTRFHVYMVGFVPGFPYMGDLPPELALPRRTDPRVKVPAGSIATAVGQTAIYPVESPGGWHLIGATPIRLFDPGRESPALFSPGDQVRFDPVDVSEFDAIAAAVEDGSYRVRCEAVDA
jgi:KipI family sensor histidine kinase inhibitor